LNVRDTFAGNGNVASVNAAFAARSPADPATDAGLSVIIVSSVTDKKMSATSHGLAICSDRASRVVSGHRSAGYKNPPANRRDIMKTWTKPAVRETEVGLEVTSYLPAEIDLI
jgi:coenzyme PQQ precursor peptide PqqA